MTAVSSSAGGVGGEGDLAVDPALDLPWLREPRQQLLRGAAGLRGGGALLLHGSAGDGAVWLARWYAARVFCRVAPAGAEPCLACIDCQRCFEGQQPDLHLVGLLESGREGKLAREIKVEQVRELCAELALTSHGGRAKVAIIAPADRLNLNAANALLKTLEEPTPLAQLVLVAAVPARLPITVRSRCTRLRVRSPAREQALEWLETRGLTREIAAAALEAVGGAPLAALQADATAVARLASETRATLDRLLQPSAEDPAVLAEAWSDANYGLRLRGFENWLTERVRRWAREGGAGSELRVAAHLRRPSPALNIRRTFELLDALREARALEDTPVNRAVLLERLLRGIAGLAARAPGGPSRSSTTEAASGSRRETSTERRMT